MKAPDAAVDVALEVERAGYRQRLEVFLPSRTAARELTADAVREGADVGSVIRTGSDVASFADEAIGIVTEDYRPALQCRKSCSYCCRKPGVLVSVPELLRILQHVSEEFSEEEVSALHDRSSQYAAQVRGHDVNRATDQSVACPLLVNDLCSVYEVRPLVCRGYNSTSMEACRRAHTDPSVLVPIFAPIKDATDAATVGMAQRLGEAGLSDAMVDLGTSLHLALESGAGVDSVLRGELDLTSAERVEWVAELWGLVSETAHQLGIRF